MSSAEDRKIDEEISRFCNMPSTGMTNDEACAEIESLLLKVGRRMVFLQYLLGLMVLMTMGLIIYTLYKTWILA